MKSVRTRVAAVISASVVVAAALVPLGGSDNVTAAFPTPVESYDINQSFNGTSTFVDKTADVASVATLDEGAIVVSFRTDGTGVGTLLSASDSGDASSNVTLSVNDGSVYFEAREDGEYLTQIEFPTSQELESYADGRWHTIALVVDGEQIRVYADGHQVHAGIAASFFDGVSDLDGMWIGRNVDNGGGQWYFDGDIGEVDIYDQPVAASDVLALVDPPTALLEYHVADGFNGTTDFVDLTSDVSAVAAVGEGAILARFRTSTSGVLALVSASDQSDPSSNLTLSINSGDIYFEVRDGGTFSNKLTTAGSWNDGEWHVAMVSVRAGATHLYLDGELIASNTSSGFFDDVADIDGMWVGRNVDSGGAQWHYAGDIGNVAIFDTPVDQSEAQTLDGPLLRFPVDEVLDGSSDFIDVTGDVDAVAGLSAGSIAARFRTNASGAAMTLLSASDQSDPSSNITFTVKSGGVYFETREAGTYSNQIEATGGWNDGNWHTAVVVVAAGDTRLYVDGYLVAAEKGDDGFFHDVNGLDGLWIGRNADSGGGQWYFDGDVEYVEIYEQPLNDSELRRQGGATQLAHTALYDNGYLSSANYRIPTMLVTSDGSLLAAADQRVSGTADSPNDINLVMRRSTDDGATWSAGTVLLDYPGSGSNGASVIDSVMLQDPSNDRIWLLIDHFRGGVGQSNSVAGTGFDSNDYLILHDLSSNEYTLRPNGDVYDSSNNLTNYHVDTDGDVTDNGSAAGNIYLKPGVDPNESLFETPTAFLKLIYSDDDGVTWSAPIDLNPQVKESWMKFIGTAPSSGIVMENGTKAGRLIFPIYYSNSAATTTFSSATIYSDDNGTTWTLGESQNDGRSYGGSTIDSETVSSSGASLHESTIVERDDGELVAYMRNSHSSGDLLVSHSSDGGETWGAVTQDTTIPEIGTLPSAVRYPDATDEVVVFANATRRVPGRALGVVRLSTDGGATWAHTRTLKAGSYVYNNLVVLPGGDIGVFWEVQNEGLLFTRITRSWIEDSLAP